MNSSWKWAAVLAAAPLAAGCEATAASVSASHRPPPQPAALVSRAAQRPLAEAPTADSAAAAVTDFPAAIEVPGEAAWETVAGPALDCLTAERIELWRQAAVLRWEREVLQGRQSCLRRHLQLTYHAEERFLARRDAAATLSVGGDELRVFACIRSRIAQDLDAATTELARVAARQAELRAAEPSFHSPPTGANP